MLLVFPEGMIGARIQTLDGTELVPGTTGIPVVLHFWSDAAWEVVRPCAKFRLWYNRRTVGDGRVIRTQAVARSGG